MAAIPETAAPPTAPAGAADGVVVAEEPAVVADIGAMVVLEEPGLLEEQEAPAKSRAPLPATKVARLTKLRNRDISQMVVAERCGPGEEPLRPVRAPVRAHSSRSQHRNYLNVRNRVRMTLHLTWREPSMVSRTPYAAQLPGISGDGGGDSRTEPAADGFRGPQVCKLVGITYRQLDYWARTGMLRPSIADARGSGTQRLYSYRDLLELKVIKQLLDAGISLQRARRAVECLREGLGVDLGSANLVLVGSGSVLARSDGEVVDLLKGGQGVLNIVPLSGVVEELDAAIFQFARVDERPATSDTAVAK